MFFKRNNDFKNLEVSFLQSELLRIIDFIKFSEQKIGFIFVIISGIFSYDISKIDIIYKNINLMNIFLSIILILFFIFVYIKIFQSIYPKINNINNNALLYYGFIGNLDLEQYIKTIGDIDLKTLKMKLLEQIHTNSLITKNKMQYVKDIIILLVGVIVINLLLIINNISFMFTK